jgi:hypothetical protein
VPPTHFAGNGCATVKKGTEIFGRGDELGGRR